MHLDEHVHAERVRCRDEGARLVVGDARHDDEDAVGAPQARLEDLVGLEQEILAQHRQAGGLAGGGKIFGPALERGLVGEHGQAGRAALGIGAGERRRIEIDADEALRRARLLDLGDQRRAIGREMALDRGGKAARAVGPRAPGARSRAARSALSRPRSRAAYRPRCGRARRSWRVHAPAFETAIRRSSTPRAAPESTACRARSTPSRRSRPARRRRAPPRH